ncbi:MAG: hypothetical protein WA695_00640 [Candidatus Dormiibacterota bacterium]
MPELLPPCRDGEVELHGRQLHRHHRIPVATLVWESRQALRKMPSAEPRAWCARPFDVKTILRGLAAEEQPAQS